MPLPRFVRGRRLSSLGCIFQRSNRTISTPSYLHSWSSFQSSIWLFSHRSYSGSTATLGGLGASSSSGSSSTVSDASAYVIEDIDPLSSNHYDGNIKVTNQTFPAPALRAAAIEGKSAMELIKTTKQPQEDELYFRQCHRQSLEQATNGLLSATKSTTLLANSIAEIRKDVGEEKGKSNAAAKSCLQELHKAFLSLAQSLLNCLDNFPSATDFSSIHSKQSPSFTARGSRDDEILDLLLTLTYRAHQLSLPFHCQLYQRMAFSLAEQKSQNITTLRSRAEWIWNLYQWSVALKEQSPIGRRQEENVRATLGTEVDTTWFHPSLLALAEGRQWSDITYLLRCILDPPAAPSYGVRGKGRRKKKRNPQKRNRKHSEYHFEVLLDEKLVWDLILTIDRLNVLPSLWRNLNSPSTMEEDLLEVLFLLESSIWDIYFQYYPVDGQYPDSDQQKKCRKEKVSSKEDSCGMSSPSLRDAIEFLLETSSKSRNIISNWSGLTQPDGIDDYFDRIFDEDRSDELDSLAKTLKDLEDLLSDQTHDSEDESDEPSQHARDAVSLAAMLSDPFFFGGGGKNSRHLRRKRLPRDLEVLFRKEGDRRFLEIRGFDISSSVTEAGTDEPSGLSGFDDVGDGDLVGDFVYTRVKGYYDHIPDITCQIYQQNGNQALRYTHDFEEEIYRRFRQPHPPYYYEDEETF